MIKRILASLRLGFALVCVGASLILAAQWFGFLPDAAAIEARARRQVCEAIAINAAKHIGKQQWVDLRSTLQSQVDRDPALLSAGIRSRYGSLRVDTGHHDDMWPTAGKPSPSVEPIEIPIMLGNRPTGKVEFCFYRPAGSSIERAMEYPVVRMLTFFFSAGMVAYTLFVVRVMGVFSQTQVVPDRVRQALDTLAEGLLILDDRGHIVLANRAFSKMVATSADQLAQSKASDLSWVTDDISQGGYPWLSVIETAEVQSERMMRLTLENGAQRILSVNAAPLGKDRSTRGALATFRDVTHVEEHRAELERMLSLLRSSRDEIQRKNHALEILATQDSLTGCLNRRAFFERFDGLWSQAQVDQRPLACIMVDVDHFKNVNDTYGHQAGDDVLRHVSRVIRELHQDHGLVCRYGGEEFCIVLPGMSAEQAMAQSEATRQAIIDIRLDDPEELRLTASLGVSELRFDAKDPQELVNQADACLYVAKREGRNRSIVYNASYERLEENEKLQQEAKREQIEIPYQAVTALVSSLSYRDAATAEHSRRVANLCARASDGLFDPVQKYVIEVAGLLHDIGKIGVPDDVLFKPSPLSEEEWSIMRRHDQIGLQIISDSFDCQPLTEVIQGHQAFFDGKSHRDGLPVGDKIPLASRLLSIADCYDSMVSNQVYAGRKTHDEAIDELRRCAGTQFDPELVEHFIKKTAGDQAGVTTGAIAVRKQAAIEIGTQVEQFAEAIIARDVGRLRLLAASVNALAGAISMDSIAEIAARIEVDAASEDCAWHSLLEQTNELLDVCRSTQSSYLKSSLEQEAEHIQI